MRYAHNGHGGTFTARSWKATKTWAYLELAQNTACDHLNSGRGTADVTAVQRHEFVHQSRFLRRHKVQIGAAGRSRFVGRQRYPSLCTVHISPNLRPNKGLPCLTASELSETPAMIADRDFPIRKPDVTKPVSSVPPVPHGFRDKRRDRRHCRTRSLPFIKGFFQPQTWQPN